MAELRVSKKAEDDLDAIAAFIAERDGAARAKAAIERTRKTMRNLALMPGIGRSRNYLDEGLRAYPVAPWTIYYAPLPDGDGIEAIRIVDRRRDLVSIFRRDQ